MRKKFGGSALAAMRPLAGAFILGSTFCMFAQAARASILTFDISDDAYASTENFPEGFGIDGEYGDRISDGTPQLATNGTTTFNYGVGSEGYTPNVTASYGPFSIFTGGPSLWRYDYGNLERVLFQGSTFTGIGNDYDVLDVVLIADPGFDVVLHDFDLGGWNQTDHPINGITVYDGIPFPFITPTNQISETFNVDVVGAGPASTHITPLTVDNMSPKAHVIWLQIDARNLGATSELIGIDNIRFGQVKNDTPDQPPVDLAEIDTALQPAAVPEAASLVVWVAGLACVMLVSQQRTARVGEEA